MVGQLSDAYVIGKIGPRVSPPKSLQIFPHFSHKDGKLKSIQSQQLLFSFWTRTKVGILKIREVSCEISPNLQSAASNRLVTKVSCMIWNYCFNTRPLKKNKFFFFCFFVNASCQLFNLKKKKKKQQSNDWD